MQNHLSLTAIFIEAPEGGFTGYFAEIPEAIAEGETEKEVETNLLSSLKTILEIRREENDGVSYGTKKTKQFNLEIA